MKTAIADYHVHTSLCNHANGTMKEYIKMALANHVTEIGFADHNPMNLRFGGRYRMRPKDMEIYLKTIYQLQQKFENVKIKIGIELDFVESEMKFLTSFVKNYNFDYVIGSIHYMQKTNSGEFFYLNEIDTDSKNVRFKKYFALVRSAAESGIFDIMGHFDLPRRFWGNLDDYETELAKDALRAIKNSNMCLEVNTSGFRTKIVEEPFPGKELLKFAKEMDIPVTLGSDSHQPEYIASYFTEAKQLLKEVGYSTITFFDQRKRVAITNF